MTYPRKPVYKRRWTSAKLETETANLIRKMAQKHDIPMYFIIDRAVNFYMGWLEGQKGK